MIASYKNYLLLHAQKAKRLPFGKFSRLFLIFALLVLGAISALFLWQYQKETPLRAQNRYLEVANGGFLTIKQSIEEVLATYQVAGAKIQVIENLKEASDQASGFYVSLDDLSRTISKTESTLNVVNSQQKELSELAIPSEFGQLNSQLWEFYQETAKLLEELQLQHYFAKELLRATGPNFYLPSLTNQAIWRIGNNEQIKSYYENLKKEADITLASLPKLTITDDFKDYYNTEIIYLELLVNVADNIIKILSQPEETDSEKATRIEKAYQLLVGAQRENELLSQKLLTEKLKFFDSKRNFERFAAIKIRQNSIDHQFADIFASQQASKFKIEKIWQKLNQFLLPLQTPTSI